MNISHQHQQQRKEEPLATAQQGKAQSMSAAVVDTSGLPRPAAARVDDDAHSLVISALTESENQQQLLMSASASSTVSPSSEDNDNNAPIQIPVVEENVGSNPPAFNSASKSEKEVMNVDSDEVNKVVDNAKSSDVDNGGGEEEDNMSDESEYEYEDDDDAAFSGFLMTNNSFGISSSVNNASTTTPSVPARIIEEETIAAASSAAASLSTTTTSTADRESEGAPRKKWREPSRAAVSMSLRAQKETSGSKRRLAQDLYRIMNQDTEEAGFSLNPQSEDSMEKWTIKLFQFDPDSNLAKDMLVVGIDHIELEMKFPEQYPFEPPFVRVVKPRFKRQTGFVMNGALCMELLTKDGWNPINDIESVIVSVRSLLVVGDGRLQAATDLTKARYETMFARAKQEQLTSERNGEPEQKKARMNVDEKKQSAIPKSQVGSYTSTEAQSAYSHLSDYHKKKGWDTSGWWARKG